MLQRCVSWARNLKQMSSNEPQMIADPYTRVVWEHINHSCRAVFLWVANQIRVSWDTGKSYNVVKEQEKINSVNEKGIFAVL